MEHSDDSKALSEFGFWMNAKNSAFDKDTTWLADRIVKTLEKTKGMVDWEIKLMDSMSTLADVAPKETLKILRLYFTELHSNSVLVISAQILGQLNYSRNSTKIPMRTCKKRCMSL